MRVQQLILSSLILVVLTALTLPPVTNDPVLPATPYDYTTLNLPAHFTTDAPNSPLPTSINGTDNTPVDNPITNDGATLGRVLFYDKNLSANGTIACASCHQAAAGFSDPAVLSVGFNGGLTSRHSMTLINSLWYQRGRFFWDERATTLEEQVLMPFQDPVEMGLTLTELETIVSQQTYYPTLFTNAFGDATVTTDRISKALAQFVRSIVSYSSDYDTGRAQVIGPGANFPNFTAEENLGKQLFFQTIPNGGGACFGCHTTEAFISANPGPQNNGLDLTTTDPGAGSTFPNNPIFEARFKTSTLRNIELSAPYMHDGRFATLEEVVEHYNSGIQAHPTLSPALTDANDDPVQLNFTAAEKAAMVAFLKTLTDNSVATEPKWSDPFATVLPVELLTFSGKTQGEGILLEWQTASEINNEGFEVERSKDGISFEKIGFVDGNGNSQTSNAYDFTDQSLAAGTYFYRLKQIDFDGKFEYSDIRKFTIKAKNIFQIFPNPASRYLYIRFSEDIAPELIVFNSLGQKVVVQTSHNNHQMILDLAQLPNGVYFLHEAEAGFVTKFVKR